MRFVALGMILLWPVEQEMDELVERLRSEKIEEREAAAQKILSMGERALPALRKLQEHRDSEVRARARDLIAEIVWRPVLPPGFDRRHRDGMATLRDGSVAERRQLYDTLLRDRQMSPAFAERIILNDPDAGLRAEAGWVVCMNPRPRHREAYTRLLQDWEKVGRLSGRDDFLEYEEYLIEALGAIADRSDVERLRAIIKGGDRTGAATLLLGEVTKELPRETLEELAGNRPYPVAARARRHLARLYGPKALEGIPIPTETFARWRHEEATVEGLVENGSPEALRAVEKFAEERLAGGSQRLPRLLARAGTERIARALLDRALSAKEGYERDGPVEPMGEMPAAAVLSALASKKDLPSVVLVWFARVILAHGDEKTILALLRARPEKPPNVRRWMPRERRDEAVRACRAILNERPTAWATRFAFRLLAIHDPQDRVSRTRTILKDPDHPAFSEAVADVEVLPEGDRKELMPSLVRRLEEAKEGASIHPFGRRLQREWIEPMRRHARSKNDDLRYAALYALVYADALTDRDRLEIAKEFYDFSYLWDSLGGRIPREEWDALRERVAKEPPHVLIPVARALAASGDARPWPRLKEILESGDDYPYGLAQVRALTEGEACVDDLMKAVPRLLPMRTQAAGEILRALSAFPGAKIEEFLFEQLENGPMTVETGSSIVGGYDPDGPPEDAIRGLVNMRSGKYRRDALRIARAFESPTYMTGSWAAAVESLGILGVEGGLEYVVEFLEDRARTVHGWYWDVPYLIALGYLGDARHEKLARHFLNDAETGPTAARVLDRLVHRDAYRKLREMREIRGLGWEDPRRLARLLSEQWGLDVRLPVPRERSYGWAPDYAVFRADGFQILDRLALLLGAVPIWRDGRVEFLDDQAARDHWTAKK